MASKSADDFTVVDLKELLKSYGLSTAGNKAELLLRLDKHDPSGQWTNTVNESAKTRKDGAPAITTVVNETASGAGSAATPGMCDELLRNRREIDLLRREKALTERELEITRRELEIVQSGRSSSVSGQEQSLVQNKKARISVRTIADLLRYFDGKSEDFLAWSKQVRVLQATYQLEDDETKILIGMRIQDKAREWMQSRPEFVEMPVDELLKKFEHMFYHRPSKIIVRQQFQDRKWKRDEPFEDYFHDKVIKANRIPIDDEDELIDHLVAGIPDQTLRNQAKMHCFDTPESLLRAFETLRLPSTNAGEHERWREQKNSTRVNHREDRQRFDGNAPRNASTKCFNCGGLNHISKYCPTKERGPKCFRCTEYGHVSSKCNKTFEKNDCNAAQTGQKKLEKEVDIQGHKLVALIDTGSDISLMRSDLYFKIGAPKLEKRVIQFRGIGCDNNFTLGQTRVEIKIDEVLYEVIFHVVSEKLIQQSLLIGSDFLNTVDVHLRQGNITIHKIENSDIPEIFKIDVVDGDALDLFHIEDVSNKIELEDVIKDYKPNRIRETGIKMRDIIKDEIPIYQRPRRLSLCDMYEADSQIKNDLITPAIGYKTALDNLKVIPHTASEHGLELNWEKCRFMQTKIRYLGHAIEDGNVSPSDDKTIAVKEFAKPNNVKDSVDHMFHPVYYASGKTTSPEEKNSSYELEVLALVKSLCKFRMYLLGLQFKIVTNCQAFTVTKNERDLCTRVARWALFLTEFSYVIEHRPGRRMTQVDALRRQKQTKTIRRAYRRGTFGNMEYRQSDTGGNFGKFTSRSGSVERCRNKLKDTLEMRHDGMKFKRKIEELTIRKRKQSYCCKEDDLAAIKRIQFGAVEFL